MSRFNRFMENHFAGCRLIAKAYDHCRSRDVSLFAIPGEFQVVGVSDGTDCWMAPVIADPFSVRVQSLLDMLREGKPLPAIGKARQRVLIAPEAPSQPARKERVRVS